MRAPRSLFGSVAIIVALSACAADEPEYPRALDMTTWSIAAIDPETGDVGVAVSSCVETFGDAVAALGDEGKHTSSVLDGCRLHRRRLGRSEVTTEIHARCPRSEQRAKHRDVAAKRGPMHRRKAHPPVPIHGEAKVDGQPHSRPSAMLRPVGDEPAILIAQLRQRHALTERASRRFLIAARDGVHQRDLGRSRGFGRARRT